MHPLPDLSVWVHSFPHARKCRMVLVFRFIPAHHHPHHHRVIRHRCLLLSGSGRSSDFRSICHGVFRPSVRICRPDPVGSVCSSGLIHRLY